MIVFISYIPNVQEQWCNGVQDIRSGLWYFGLFNEIPFGRTRCVLSSRAIGLEDRFKYCCIILISHVIEPLLYSSEVYRPIYCKTWWA